MSVPKQKVRGWYISEALKSFQRLTEILSELTEDEVLAALKLESQTQRRRSITNRLISRAVRIQELEYSSILKSKYTK